MEKQTAIELIVEEYEKASKKFPAFNSAHEGYAVLLEEVDELWAEIKNNNAIRYQPEAVRVGAMALRFLIDICEKNNKALKIDAMCTCGKGFTGGHWCDKCKVFTGGFRTT